MKKILIILLFLATTKLFAQQQIESKNVKFNVPSYLAKIQKKNSKTNSIQNENKIMAIVRINSLRGQKFIGDGSIKFLQYIDTTIYVRGDYILKLKGDMDNMAIIEGGKALPWYSSTIKKINNYDVLIIKNLETAEYTRYLIYTVNSEHNKLFSSIVLISKNDPLAEKAIDELLRSIKFK